MNSVVNPALLRWGLVGKGASELGTIEHIGRHSGVRRLTPVHPEPTKDGFRIVVPLGPKSEWVRNVVAAGTCRLQLHDRIYELDEPTMVPAGDVEDVPMPIRRLMAALGFQYLKLHTFTASPGCLPTEAPPVAIEEPVATEAVLVG